MMDAEEKFRRLWMCREIAIQEIADHYGVSRQAIHRRAQRRGLPPRGVRSDAKIKNRAIFREMWLGGVTCADIASHFGVGETVVRRCAEFEGLPRRRRSAGQGGFAGWGSMPISAWREELLAEAMRAETQEAR